MQKVNWTKWNSKDNNFQKTSHIKSVLVYGEPPENQQFISIVILTFKRAHGLKVALESALAQDYASDFYITVVDDSGYDKATDELMQTYCKEYKNIIYYRHEKNLGQYANWNRACELAPSKWFCLLHDDDWLEPQYLIRVSSVLESNAGENLGLLGVYFTTVDQRKNNVQRSLLKKTFDSLITLFIKMRRGNPIPITLYDNMRQIYVLSCCLMINRKKVIEIGGLDDLYYPSSDFVLSSKMNYYYSTAFLPEYLCFRGIGENESLKREVCEGSIKCAYRHTLAMIETVTPLISESAKKRKASFAAVAAEIGVLGYDDLSYAETKHELGMKNIYNSKVTRVLLFIKSRFAWGLLLFRVRSRK